MTTPIPSVTKSDTELQGSLTTSGSNGSAIDNYGNTWSDASTGVGTPQYKKLYTLSALGGNSNNPYAPVNTLGQQNSTGIATDGNGTGSVVSTSGPVVAGEKATVADVQGLINNDTSGITTSHQDYLDMLQKQSDALEQRRTNEIAGINSQFDQKNQQLGESQKGETGTFTSTLARIGGYLGDSASASGAMINLNQQHVYQVNDLESKRQSALQEAKNAIDDKQFALAQAKAQEAKDYAKEIQTSKQTFFENSLKILNAQQSQDEAQRAAIKDKLTNLSFLKPEQITPEAKKEIDTFYGTPGFTDNYIAVTNATAAAKSQKDVMDARTATLNFLQNIPAGQKIKMPDGTEFTGMGKAGDVATFMQTDGNGVGHLITYNKLTGAKSVTNLGVVGKASGGGSKPNAVVTDNATALFQTNLESTKLKDNTYDPDTYLQLRNQLKESKNAALLPYMDNKFLNKANGFFNDDAINKLRKKGVFYGDALIPDTTNDTTNNNGDNIQSDNSN